MATGRALAVIAAITVFIAAVATFTKILPRYSLEAAGLALFAGLLTRIITLDSRSAGIAEAAKQNPNFLAYDAGFAWGAWCILLGLVLVFLGLAVGLLRVIDVRRGLPE